MVRSSILRVVDFCSRYAWWVIVLAVALAIFSAAYTARHFAVKTDVKDLFPPDLPWTQRAFAYMKEFPQPEVLVVVDAPTPELVDGASSRLAKALLAHKDLLRNVYQTQGGFFESNGLLYLPTPELAKLTNGLASAGPLLQTLAADPSLRGALGALSLGLTGVQYGQVQLDDLARPISMAADAVQAALEGKPASFSWRLLASGRSAEPQELRRFIEVEPVLDYAALEPGRAATNAIEQTAHDLHLATDDQARVRLTGLVPMNDDQFATIRENAPINAAVSLAAVLVVLWLALRYARIIFAVTINLVAGLAIAAAFGLWLVGALNIISVAFFVLFIGLGVDFGLQFSVRYRAERHDYGDLRRRAAQHRAQGRSTLGACCRSDRGGVLLVSADILPRSLGTRSKLRLRDDHRLSDQCHIASGALGRNEAAGREAPDGFRSARTCRLVSRAPSRAGHRDHALACSTGLAVTAFLALRFQPASRTEPARPLCRYFSRPAKGSSSRRQCDQHRGAR